MPPTLPTHFTSERLLLRRYRLADAPAYFRMLRENQAHLREFLPPNLAAAQNEDDIRAVITWQIKRWQRGELFILGLWEKSSGEYVGEVYLANADWEVPCIEVGYFTVQQQGGKGYAAKPPVLPAASPLNAWACAGWSCSARQTTKKAPAWPGAAGSPWRAACASAPIRKKVPR